MTITAKYSPGDTVWFLDFKSSRHDAPKIPFSSTVGSISTVTLPDGKTTAVKYFVSNRWRHESELFSSQEEYLKSIK